MTWFETFFKHKPIVYEKGTLGFQFLESPFLFVIFVIGAAVGAFFLYRSVQRTRSSWGMLVLRAATFTILAFILMRPVMNISTVLPLESYIAVVVDNSESMLIRDDGLDTRADLLMRELESTEFFRRLSEKFRG